jgi:beta-glucanase (GH16 family)
MKDLKRTVLGCAASTPAARQPPNSYRYLLALSALALTLLAVLPAKGGWQLVWNDEFLGSEINTNNWTFGIGTGPPYPGWGNNELEYYTSRPENAYVSDGVLNIVARKESHLGSSYTSAKLTTLGTFSQTYGRFEFRAALPTGQGYWPALWMMPLGSVYGTWAASGEIDVMENTGGEPENVLGTIQFGGESPNNTQSYGPEYSFGPGTSVLDFHVYALEWTNNAMRWYVDSQLFETQTNWWSSGAPYPAPFNQPFYIILSLAVGGNFALAPTPGTVFPGYMKVDYVRVYEWVDAPPLSIALTASNTIALSWPYLSPSYFVQQRADLTAANGWTRVGTIVSNPTNLWNQVMLPAPSAPCFYRLSQ